MEQRASNRPLFKFSKLHRCNRKENVMSVTQAQLKQHFIVLGNKGAIYVWGANGQIITEDLMDMLYKYFKSNTYNRAYYDNKLKEGKGKPGADCSGAIFPVSGYDTTAAGYYNRCVQKGTISSNPAKGIKLIQFDEVTKQILSIREIQKLALTSCTNNEVKRAFLFSCYCGMRWCDINRLTFQHIDFQAKRITIVQQKVQSHSHKAILHLNLSTTAIRLLQLGTTHSKYVFQLPSYSYSLSILRQWVSKAGIRKHISFHCARHSFITHIMAKGANIKTAAALAGHSTTRHTEKYVHIIDELKQKAVDSLPDIDISFR